jgi:hypothetical protein
LVFVDSSEALRMDLVLTVRLGIRTAHPAEERGPYRKMRVGDLLQFLAELKGVRRARPEIRRWLERMCLADCEHRNLRPCRRAWRRSCNSSPSWVQ